MEVSIVHIEIDGIEEENIKKVYEGARTRRKAVHMMHRTGAIRQRLRPTVGFDLVVSEGVPERNYEGMEHVPVVLVYEDGTRIRYMNCSHEKTGESTFDEENELVKRIDFIADERIAG